MMKLRRMMLRTFHRSHFGCKFTGKMPDAIPAASILCEGAQSKCTWTFHKSHFVRKFIYRENAGRPGYHLD